MTNFERIGRPVPPQRPDQSVRCRALGVERDSRRFRCRRSQLADVVISTAGVLSAATGAASAALQSPEKHLAGSLSALHSGQSPKRRIAIATESLIVGLFIPGFHTAHRLTSGWIPSASHLSSAVGDYRTHD